MLDSLGITSLDLDGVTLILHALTLIAGGVWALYLLRALRKREIAQAGLAVKEAELRELELKSKRFAAVSISISAEVHQGGQGGPYLLVAGVSILNQGSRNTRIEWDGHPAPFIIRQCDFAADGSTTYRAVAERFAVQTQNPNVRLKSHYLRTGASETLSFAVPITEPGLYLLSFRAPTDPAEREETGSTLPAAWTSSRLVMIGGAFGDPVAGV